MKNVVHLLLCVMSVLTFTSCENDIDLPDVDFELEISSGIIVDGKIYSVVGDTLSIDAIKVINREHGKNAGIGYADYYWNTRLIGRSVCSPFGFKIVMRKNMTEQMHQLGIYAPVYAVDKDAAFAYLVYPVYVVNSAEDLPTNGAKSVKSPGEIHEMNMAPES